MDGYYTGRAHTGIKASLVMVGAVAALSLCLTASASSAATPAATQHRSKKHATMTNITIVSPSTAASAILPLFAKRTGIFRKFHINATISFLGSSLALPELATGRVQFGEMGSPQPEEARQSGANVRWVAQWVLRSNLQLVAAPGISSPAELQGKSIAVSHAGSVTDIFAHWVVQQAGIPISSVKYVPLGHSAGIVAGFIGGSVDALLLSPPNSTNAVQGRQGSSVILDTNSPKFNYPFQGLAAYMPWVNTHKKAATEVLEALQRALDEFPKKPKAAEAAILAAVPGTSEADLVTAYKSALSVFGNTIVPDPSVEKSALTLLQQFYPGQYPYIVPSKESLFYNRSYALQAERMLKKGAG